ncbi:cell division protein SepF [Candidatus Micrarchaeota archaeon]|nr:cell division protein SepF [Candidatus Micrarchaeota archaeon]
MNLDDFMDSAEAEEVDVMHSKADGYVKPIALQTESDLRVVEEELRNRNIVLMNIQPVLRNPTKFKDMVNRLKDFVKANNGDIARIDEDKILLTPTNWKIVKRRK